MCLHCLHHGFDEGQTYHIRSLRTFTSSCRVHWSNCLRCGYFRVLMPPPSRDGLVHGVCGAHDTFHGARRSPYLDQSIDFHKAQKSLPAANRRRLTVIRGRLKVPAGQEASAERLLATAGSCCVLHEPHLLASRRDLSKVVTPARDGIQ